MTANWVSTQISCGPNSGRIVDTARGILIGLRRCPSEIAFDELFSAAQRHNVPVFAMAWALVRPRLEVADLIALDRLPPWLQIR